MPIWRRRRYPIRQEDNVVQGAGQGAQHAGCRGRQGHGPRLAVLRFRQVGGTTAQSDELPAQVPQCALARQGCRGFYLMIGLLGGRYWVETGVFCHVRALAPTYSSPSSNRQGATGMSLLTYRIPVSGQGGGEAAADGMPGGRGGNPSRMVWEKSSWSLVARARAVMSLRRFSSSSPMLVLTVPFS